MNEINNSNVKSLAQLRIERARLRNEISLKEDDLAVYYRKAAEIMQPVNRVMHFLSGKNSKSEGKTGIVGKIFKIAVPLIAGRQVLKHKKQLLFKPLLGYFLQQGVQYFTSKKLKSEDTEIDIKHEAEKPVNN